MIKNILILITFFQISINTFAGDTTNVTAGKYTFRWYFDDSTYTTQLKIKVKDKIIYDVTHELEISNITAKDLDNDGTMEYLFDFYTGGAHCCTELYVYHIKGQKLVLRDSLFLGNSGYEISDIDRDGISELEASDDRFAYAFTSYAGTSFGIIILNFENGKFIVVNERFKDKVLDDIKEKKKEVVKYIKEYGFECPADDTTNTWGTPAGDIKVMLAAIALNFSTIGETEEGISYIRKIYKCPDMTNYINEVMSALSKK